MNRASREARLVGAVMVHGAAALARIPNYLGPQHIESPDLQQLFTAGLLTIHHPRTDPAIVVSDFLGAFIRPSSYWLGLAAFVKRCACPLAELEQLSLSLVADQEAS